MTQYGAPLCYRCKNFKSNPQFIGDSGKCSKYPTNIPKKIFYQSGDCSFFTNAVDVKKSPRKKKK